MPRHQAHFFSMVLLFSASVWHIIPHRFESVLSCPINVTLNGSWFNRTIRSMNACNHKQLQCAIFIRNSGCELSSFTSQSTFVKWNWFASMTDIADVHRSTKTSTPHKHAHISNKQTIFRWSKQINRDKIIQLVFCYLPLEWTILIYVSLFGCWQCGIAKTKQNHFCSVQM